MTARNAHATENPQLEVKLEPDNSISRYMEYGKMTGDAYPEYHYGMALSLHSIVICRNLVLRLSQGEVFPNIWAFMLGRSTISRKSAAIAKGQQFTKDLVPYTSLPQSYSPEGLIEELSENPRSYLIKDEAGAMLAAMAKNYMLEMRDLYCILYDCQSYRRKLRSGQRKEKRLFEVNDPYINIVTATTPETFREYTTVLDLTSGWLLRFIYFYPNYTKEWMGFKPAGEEDFALYGEVLSRLSRIKGLLYNREEPVEIFLEDDAWSYYQAWQETSETALQDITDTIHLALWGRLSFYALKLAMLFTVGRSDYQEDTKVSLAHITEACRQIDEYFMPTGKLVAAEVAMGESSNLQNRILGILSRNGGQIQWSKLLQNLHVPVRQVEEAVAALMASEEIEDWIEEREGKKLGRCLRKKTFSSISSNSSIISISSISMNSSSDTGILVNDANDANHVNEANPGKEETIKADDSGVATKAAADNGISAGNSASIPEISKPLRNPRRSRSPRKSRRSSGLDGLSYHLLKSALAGHDIDEQYIDPGLDYWENKGNLESQFGIKLCSSEGSILREYQKKCDSFEAQASELRRELQQQEAAVSELSVFEMEFLVEAIA